MTHRSRFHHFKTSPEVIRLAATMHIRLPISFRKVEQLPKERGVEASQKTKQSAVASLSYTALIVVAAATVIRVLGPVTSRTRNLLPIFATATIRQYWLPKVSPTRAVSDRREACK